MWSVVMQLLRMQEHVHERDDDKTSIHYLSSLSFFESESLIKPVQEKKSLQLWSQSTPRSSKCCVTFSGAPRAHSTPVQSPPVEGRPVEIGSSLPLKVLHDLKSGNCVTSGMNQMRAHAAQIMLETQMLRWFELINFNPDSNAVEKNLFELFLR